MDENNLNDNLNKIEKAPVEEENLDENGFIIEEDSEGDIVLDTDPTEIEIDDTDIEIPQMANEVKTTSQAPVHEELGTEQSGNITF